MERNHKKIYQESIFAEIGKLLSLSKIQKDLDKAKDLVGEDPDLQETMDTLKYHYQKLEKTLPAFCKRYPDSPACKNLKENSQYVNKKIRETISDLELDINDMKVVPDEELVRRYDVILSKRKKAGLNVQEQKYFELLRDEILFKRKLDLTKF